MIRKPILVSFLVIFLFCGIKSAEIPDDICDGINFGYLAHPDPSRCTEYIICLFEEHHLFSCAYPGYIFYLPYTYCVRGDPETCQVLISVTTLSPTTTTLDELGSTPEEISTTQNDFSTTPVELTTTQPETSTATISDGLSTTTSSVPNFPTPPMTILTTTTEFYEPSSPMPTVDDEITANTTITTESESETTTESARRPTGPPELCESTRFRFVADPDFCYRYYLCIAGVAFPGECEQDRIFNEFWQACINGDWDTCAPSDWILKGRKLN